MSLPPTIPPTLKQVSHFMKVAAEHDQRDPVVAYWARFHTIQKSLTIDRSSPPAKQFIGQLLTWLESKKKEMAGNEAVTNETVAQAHVENYALKLFKYADDADRKGNFNKNTIKAFYTSSLLIDVLENFEPISEEFDKMRKYGKWKAAYIHNCLKNGETPVSGPVGGGEDEEDAWDPQFGGMLNNGGGAATDNNTPNQTTNQVYHPDPTSFFQQPAPPQTMTVTVPIPEPTATLHSVALLTTAQKYTKFASSALNFDDVPSAIVNLKKALHLLETGTELVE